MALTSDAASGPGNPRGPSYSIAAHTGWHGTAVWIVALVVSLTGCRSSAPGRNARIGATQPLVVGCAGALTVVNDVQLAAVGRCSTWTGDIRIRGGAITGAGPMPVQLTRIVGTLRVGPTLQGLDWRFFSRLEEVTGNFIMSSNLATTGVFSPRLRRISGDMDVVGNVAATGIGLPALETVDGSLRIADNPSLGHVDLSALTRVGGDLRIVGNASLELVITSSLETVAGGVEIADNPRLSESTGRALTGTHR